MKNTSGRGHGIALLLGTLFLFVTMVLHPAGGSVEHLQRMSSLIIVSHSIALGSVPFLLFGYWGLKVRLAADGALATFAFITTCYALLAAMCAAAINGLALPFFLGQHIYANPESIETVRIVLKYNLSLNHAFDLVYICGSCGATIMWSAAIYRTRKLPVWIGYYGFLLSITGILMLVSDFEFLSLDGFRVFVFGYVSWTTLVGYHLWKFNRPKSD